MTAKPYEMWSAAAVDSRLSPVEVTVEMSMETTGRLLNVAGTCRRRHACQLAVCYQALSDVPTTRRAIGSGPVRTLARWCLVRSLLKEALRLVFQLPYDEAVPTLDAWIGWARRCRIPRFVKLQRTIVAHRDTILASIEHHLSNGLIESVNTKIRLITRTAFGFASPDALIALAMLNLGGHRPVLPGRT